MCVLQDALLRVPRLKQIRRPNEDNGSGRTENSELLGSKTPKLSVKEWWREERLRLRWSTFKEIRYTLFRIIKQTLIEPQWLSKRWLKFWWNFRYVGWWVIWILTSQYIQQTNTEHACEAWDQWETSWSLEHWQEASQHEWRELLWLEWRLHRRWRNLRWCNVHARLDHWRIRNRRDRRQPCNWLNSRI